MVCSAALALACSGVTGGEQLHISCSTAARAPPSAPRQPCLCRRAGTNKNYPNPPGWGLSLHVNGFETPVLRVVRGVAYNFTIQAGETHPVYITDTIIGGGARAPRSERVGGPDLHSSYCACD